MWQTVVCVACTAHTFNSLSFVSGRAGFSPGCRRYFTLYITSLHFIAGSADIELMLTVICCNNNLSRIGSIRTFAIAWPQRVIFNVRATYVLAGGPEMPFECNAWHYHA